MSRCASCGLPGHRYGRNEGMERYDPMACINQLRDKLEDLANGQRVEVLVDIIGRRPGEPDLKVHVQGPALVVPQLLVDPPTEEEV